MNDAEFKKQVLQRLDSIDQRVGAIEADTHTIKTVLQIDEHVDNLRTVFAFAGRRPAGGAQPENVAPRTG